MAISPAMDDPIHFMFGSRLGFSGSADRMNDQIQDGNHDSDLNDMA